MKKKKENKMKKEVFIIDNTCSVAGINTRRIRKKKKPNKAIDLIIMFDIFTIWNAYEIKSFESLEPTKSCGRDVYPGGHEKERRKQRNKAH